MKKNLSGDIKIKKTLAFSIAELLVYMVVLSLLMLPLLNILKESVNSSIIKTDLSIIQNRFEKAYSVIELPIFYAGMGVPLDHNEYKMSFNNVMKSPFFWNGPISVVQDGRYTKLRLVYAVNLGVTVTKTKYLHKNDDKTISLSSNLDRILSRQTPLNIRNIILIPSSYPSRTPFIVEGIHPSERKLNISSYINNSYTRIPEGSSIYQLSAYEISARNGILYATNYRVTGDQPLARGVDDINFELDIDRKILKIYFLMRGRITYPKIQPISNLSLWPDTLQSDQIKKNSYYKRRVYKCVFPLVNCRDE
ncbi:MAG: hypothetical protein RR203_07670 [Synergistaceae bacterium]